MAAADAKVAAGGTEYAAFSVVEWTRGAGGAGAQGDLRTDHIVAE